MVATKHVDIAVKLSLGMMSRSLAFAILALKKTI